MKQLDLRFKGLNQFKPTVLIDDKIVKVKKNDFGSYQCVHQTEKDSVNVKIVRYLEINSPIWFLMSLLFFFVSILGIFEPHYDKKCVIIDAEFDINLNEKDTVTFSLSSNPEKAVDVETACEFQEIKNKRYVDKTAKKRLKTMFWIKFALWIMAIILTIVLIIKL